MSKQKRIVIDDEEALCGYVRKVAEAQGYKVTTTTGAKEFLRAFDADPPDVVIMDIILPDMDGIELIQQLSDHDCTAAIIVISGYEQLYIGLAEKLGSAKNLNIVDTFTKPVRLAALSEALEKAAA